MAFLIAAACSNDPSDQDADTAACNEELYAVYQAVTAYVQSLGSVCAGDTDCTVLGRVQIGGCGFECGYIAPTAHAQDIIDFVATDPTITQHCETAEAAGCLAQRLPFCPYQPPRCQQGQCVGGL